MDERFHDAEAFDSRIALFSGSEFRATGERSNIEELVQEYVDRPQLHSRLRTLRLLGLLLQSELAPTARIADTGLDPSGLILSLCPRYAQWITYGIFLVLSVAAALRASSGHYDLAVAIGAAAVFAFPRWWQVRHIIAKVDTQILRELRSGHFHPGTLCERLWRLEGRGFCPHSNVYALLRIEDDLRAQRKGTADNKVRRVGFIRRVGQ